MNLKRYLIKLPLNRAASSFAVLLLVLCMSMLPGIATASTANNEKTTFEDYQMLQSTTIQNNTTVTVDPTVTILDEPSMNCAWYDVTEGTVWVVKVNHTVYADGKLELISDSGEVIAIIDHTDYVNGKLLFISDSGEVMGTTDDYIPCFYTPCPEIKIMLDPLKMSSPEYFDNIQKDFQKSSTYLLKIGVIIADSQCVMPYATLPV